MRKTAAVCVAKLYDINPELVEDRGFLDALKVMLCHCRQQQTSAHAKPSDTFMTLCSSMRGSVSFTRCAEMSKMPLPCMCVQCKTRHSAEAGHRRAAARAQDL